MFTVEEICEEQERQYNQLMQEDDQYCHPESFKWGFEHGVEYALTKLGWHPASELPIIPKNYICVEVLFRTKYGVNHLGKYFGDKWISYDDYTYKTDDISYWMEVQPPRKEDKK